MTTIHVTVDKESTRVSALVHLAQLAGANPATAIPARLRLRFDGAPFHSSEASLSYDPSGEMVSWQGRIGKPASTVAIDAPVFADYPGDTTVVLVYRDGRLVDRGAVDRDSPAAILGETASAVFRRFLEMGIHHILSGADHVLFIFGLILAQQTLRGLLGLITAFTFAHSITLSLTALNLGALPSRFVEPVIALSIVAVGVENFLRKSPGVERRMWFVFGFGLFHGFGFAGALVEAGLPSHAVPWSLASFNLGVEVGQAGVIFAAVPLLRVLLRLRPVVSETALRYASGAIAAIGLLWFAERLAGTSFLSI